MHNKFILRALTLFFFCCRLITTFSIVLKTIKCKCKIYYIFIHIIILEPVPPAQSVKRWPIDLAVPDSSHAGSGNLSEHVRGSIAHGLLLSISYCPDMTEILLKDIKMQVIHPFFNLDRRYVRVVRALCCA